MAKIRIHELAKEIAESNSGLDSKVLTQDIITLLQNKGSDAKSHMSSVSDEDAELIRGKYMGKKEKAATVKEPAPEKKSESTAPKADNISKTDNSSNASKRPSGGVLRSRDGKEIKYRVAQDGRLINTADNSVLPFKMSPDGNIMSMDGRILMRRSSEGKAPQQPQQQKVQPKPPVSQVFDGRSDRDKQRAANNASQNKNTGNKGALTNSIGDKISVFASQIDPSAPTYTEPSQPKKKKTDADFPLPVLPDDFKAPKTPVQTQTEEKKVQNETEEPVKTEQVKPVETKPQSENTADSNKAAVQPQKRNDAPHTERQNTERQERPNRDGQRPYGDRPQGERRPYGDRPQGDRQGYQNRDGQRPYGDRPQGERRPYGDRPQGDRPGFQGNRGGFGGQGGFQDKDKDDTQRRSFARKNDSRSSGGSIKSELANELGKDKRAENLKDRKNFKSDRRDRGDYDEDGGKKGPKKDPNRKGAFQKPVVKPVAEVEDEIKTIEVPEVITIKELADKMKQPSAVIIKKLFLAGKMKTLNSEITYEEAEEIALEFDIICEKEVQVNIVEELLKEAEEDPSTLVERPPVVCVMGHVDHGKTSLLDAIRNTNVTAREAGGITQHIGAYMVEINGKKITFLDTPGHEAFTSMRMRGAQSTDIAILVVAADDGVMPQTIEAINHAKAAGVQIIIAINKIDKPGANIDRVKQELTEYELVAEDWGGDTVMVPVSAKSGEGIESLLEMVLLTADVLELRANFKRKARGIVIEAKLDKGRGPVATVLVQKGTLNVGETVVIGSAHGKVRAMIDDKGRNVKSATPSTPVEILGLDGVPSAGEVMLSVADEKEARTIAEAYITQSKEQLVAESKKNTTLENLFSQMQEGEVKNLNIIIKADVMGSVEAVKQSLVKLSNEEVAVRVIHGGVGNINESDVNLAAASDAIVIGFNVKPDNTAKDIAEHENIDVKLYRVIYDAINDVEAAMKGMLKPIYQEKVIGHAEVRQLFKASGVGIIAGSFVLDGKIVRGSMARISREGKQIWEGNLASLKRFKDDVKEVAAGYECGLVFEKYSDLAELDTVEFYIMEEVPRK